jgi:hypothetical protein
MDLPVRQKYTSRRLHRQQALNQQEFRFDLWW